MRSNNALAGVAVLRSRLGQSCKAAGAATCTFGELRANGTHTNARAMGAVLHAYWTSTFCLQPGGDTVTRKGIVDSLLLGCIPVLFQRGQLLQWPWHWGAWVEQATVHIDETDVLLGRVDPVYLLRSIPPARVAEKQAAIARHAHRMHYAAVDTAQLPLPAQRGYHGSTDAFEIALHGAWRRAEALEAREPSYTNQ